MSDFAEIMSVLNMNSLVVDLVLRDMLLYVYTHTDDIDAMEQYIHDRLPAYMHMMVVRDYRERYSREFC